MYFDCSGLNGVQFLSYLLCYFTKLFFYAIKFCKVEISERIKKII
jgi:hypothetical protein